MFTTAPREKNDQIAWETHTRARLAVLTIAGAIIYELSSSILNSTLSNAPNVGLVQGLAPALRGVANPDPSPALAYATYLSHKGLPTISASVLAAISIVFAVLALNFVAEATRFRRPGALSVARFSLWIGGVGFAILSIAHEVIDLIETHNLVHGHDFSNAAVVKALSTNTAITIVQYAGIPIAIAFAGAVGVIAFAAQRVGLFPKILGWFGLIVAVLFILQVPVLQILTSLWLAAVGFLLTAKWPGGDPPAWASGEARPWPSAAEQRMQREGEAGEAGAPAGRTRRQPRGRATAAGSGEAAKSLDSATATATAVDGTPEPSAPEHSRSNKRKRRRRS